MPTALSMLPLLLLLLLLLVELCLSSGIDEHQPLSRIQLHRSRVKLDASASVAAYPQILGLEQATEVDTVYVSFKRQDATAGDWIGVFSPARFSSLLCSNDTENEAPKLCNAPLKFQHANFSKADYASTGAGFLNFRIINQREDFSFALFTGGFENPVLVAVSNVVSFANPKAPAYPRIALGKSWNEITVTWTSGYGLDEATPFVAWYRQDDKRNELHAPASTLTFTRNDMCGAPAKTVGWRDPGFIHTSFLQDLWPNAKYRYKTGHMLRDGSLVFGSVNHFTAPPSPGQDSLQRVIVFGDMGKSERDLSNVYRDYQSGALNTTDRLFEDLDNYDAVFHIGDIVYSNGYLSQWDQFTEQVQGIASKVPYMIASGNHERDWPLSGSIYNGTDSGGECGVPAQTYFNMPAKNRAKFWYSADYGMFHFCIADSENDWREGSEQYKFLEACLTDVDRQKQPWLIFIAHRVLGYSSAYFRTNFSEPNARENLEKLWHKHKVDIAFYGHIHQYERTYPVYEGVRMSSETEHYSGAFNATMHIVAGGAGAHLSPEATSGVPSWSLLRDVEFGFVKLTAYNHSHLLFEYKRSGDGLVHDKFTISREYRDVLGCNAADASCDTFTISA